MLGLDHPLASGFNDFLASLSFLTAVLAFQDDLLARSSSFEGWSSFVLEDFTRTTFDDRLFEPFLVEAQESKHLAQSFRSRHAAWTVAQAYEAFETFLLDLAAASLRTWPNKIDVQKRKNFERPHGQSFDLDDQESLRRFVAKQYRDNGEKLTLLLRLGRLQEEYEAANRHGFSLRDWFCVMTKLRHAVTHSQPGCRYFCWWVG